MKKKEEELNATICKLEANISSLKASLASEESQKLVRVLFKRWFDISLSLFFHYNWFFVYILRMHLIATNEKKKLE